MTLTELPAALAKLGIPEGDVIGVWLHAGAVMRVQLHSSAAFVADHMGWQHGAPDHPDSDFVETNADKLWITSWRPHLAPAVEAGGAVDGGGE